MSYTSGVLTWLEFKRNLRQLCGTGRWLIPLFWCVAMLLLSAPPTHAQTTAQLTGTVQDSTGGVIPGAQVTMTDEATGAARVVQTNGQGLYAFPATVPGTYTVKASAKGFQLKELTGLVVHAGDQLAIPVFSLTVGSEAMTVTVSAASEMIATDSGQRTSVLDAKQIENLALQGRDMTELLKVLPGATTMSGGLTQTSPSFSDLNITVQQSSIGNGIDLNGAVNRSGTALLSDGANIIDVGDNAASLSIIVPDFTAEVSVQASNFGADMPFGPVVVSAISKSGGSSYHGEAYFNARNSALNANDWQDNHQGVPQGPQHYYYPGGSFGGPVPLTHKKLLFWGGYQRWLQNQGNANHLSSYIPTPEMMAGDFSTDNSDNTALCPEGFFHGAPPGGYPQGPGAATLAERCLRTARRQSRFQPRLRLAPTQPEERRTPQMGARSFPPDSSIQVRRLWPKSGPRRMPIQQPHPVAVNYYQAIPNINDGWVYRFRIDYQLGEKTKIYWYLPAGI